MTFLLLFASALFPLSSFAKDPCEGCDGPTESREEWIIPDCCPGCDVLVRYIITHCSNKKKKILITGFYFDNSDPDCQPFWQWINDTIANWMQFMHEAFYKVSISEAHREATEGTNINCSDNEFITYEIYWKACVDLTSIEIPNRPIVWCKFGNCCLEWYRFCKDQEGEISVIDHGIQRLSDDRCQDEPGRFCVPAMCD